MVILVHYFTRFYNEKEEKFCINDWNGYDMTIDGSDIAKDFLCKKQIQLEINFF
jgi:hypothetical protein